MRPALAAAGTGCGARGGAIFAELTGESVPSSGANLSASAQVVEAEEAALQAVRELPGLDSNQQPSG